VLSVNARYLALPSAKLCVTTDDRIDVERCWNDTDGGKTDVVGEKLHLWNELRSCKINRGIF
jgi:hypothetical protein